MRCIAALFALAALAATAPVGAMELLDQDLRLGLVFTGHHLETKTSSAGGSATVKDGFDSANRITLDYLLALGTPVLGLTAGGGIAVDRNKLGNGGGDYTNTTLRLEGGPYLPILAIMRLELLGFIGIGQAKLTVSGSGSDSGTSKEYGLVLNLMVRPPALPLVAGVGVGYVSTTSEHSLSAAGSAVRYDLSGDNVFATVFAGIRF